MKKSHYMYQRKYRKNHPEYRKRNHDSYYQRNTNPLNSRARYTNEEIAMILNHEMTDTEIATKLGRTIRAIQMARHKYMNWGDNNEKS